MKVFELMTELAKYPAGMEVEIALSGEGTIINADRVAGLDDEYCLILGNYEPPKDEAAKSK